MSLEIRLNAYEGPLDLLLKLIEKNKVDIYDIPIAMITDQYLEYVAGMNNTDLDVLSDFLVMASTLLDIKSKMLLPPENDESGEEIDPRTELVERLIEYKEFKMISSELSGVYKDTPGAFFRNESLPQEVKHHTPEIDVMSLTTENSLRLLSEAFRLLMARQADKVDPIRAGFGNIKKDPVRISDKLTHIFDFGPKKRHFSFRELIEAEKTRADCVVTFLACLELIKIGRLSVHQEESFSDIELLWNEDCDAEITKEDLAQYD